MTTTATPDFTLDVDPESLRTAAQRWHDVARTLELRSAKVAQAPLEVACTWTGGGAEKVKAEMTALGTKLSALRTTSASTAKTLEALATSYEDAQERAAALSAQWRAAHETHAEAEAEAARRDALVNAGSGTKKPALQVDNLTSLNPQGADLQLILTTGRISRDLEQLRSELVTVTRNANLELVELQPLDARDIDLALPVTDLYGNLLRYSFKPSARFAAAEGLPLLSDAMTVPTSAEIEAFTTFGLTVPDGYVRDSARGEALLDELEARVQAASSLPPDAAMAQVEQWVDSLSAADKVSLTLTDPKTVGSTPGVPVSVRYAANRLNITAEIQALKTELRKAEQFGKARVVSSRVVDPVAVINDQIAAYEGMIAADRQVLTFTPAVFDATSSLTEQPRIAVVTGDLTTAKNISLLVGGVGTNLGDFDNQIERTARFADADSASIAWYEYDAPQMNQSIVSAVSQDRAQKGGKALAEFSQSFRTPNAERTTYMGHSYGSVVLAQAIRQGLDVDAAVFIGSPGVGQTVVDAAALGAPTHTRMYAMSHPNDPISNTSWHGYDPAETPGFTPLAIDDDRSGMGAHQGYFHGDSGDRLVALTRGQDVTTLPEATKVDYGKGMEFWLSTAAGTAGALGKADEYAEASYEWLRDDAPDHLLDAGVATRDWTGDRYEDAKKVLGNSRRIRLINPRMPW